MKNTFSRKFTVCTLAGVLGAAFIGCGDDGSSSPKGTGLPAEVADKAELETYECSMDVIGEKVYVADLELNYEYYQRRLTLRNAWKPMMPNKDYLRNSGQLP